MAAAELSFTATQRVPLTSLCPPSQQLANDMEVDPPPGDNSGSCPSGSTTELADAKGTVRKMLAQKPTQSDHEANKGELQEHPCQATTTAQPSHLSDRVHRTGPK